MKKGMVISSAILLILFAACTVIYNITDLTAMEMFSITFGVAAYHFVMRLGVGYLIDRCLNLSLIHIWQTASPPAPDSGTPGPSQRSPPYSW